MAKDAALTVVICSRCHHALHSVMLMSENDGKHYITLTCGHCTQQMQFEVLLLQTANSV